jgi:hypothetical protein
MRLLRKRQETWPEELWHGRDPERLVWRVEFQFRHGALGDFRIGHDRVNSVATPWRSATP